MNYFVCCYFALLMAVGPCLLQGDAYLKLGGPGVDLLGAEGGPDQERVLRRVEDKMSLQPASTRELMDS